MKNYSCLLVMVILAIPCNCYSQSVDLLGHWPGGPCQAVAINSDYSFMNSGGFLGIVENDNASLVSHTKIADQIYTLFAKDDLLYVAALNEGVFIIDVSDPASPKILSQLDEYAMDCLVEDDRLYVAASTQGLYIYDISNPESPVLLGNGSAWGYTRGVAVKGNYAYIPQSSMGLKKVNISDPSDLSTFSEIEITNRTAVNVKVYSDYLYVGSLGEDNFEIFDVSDPSNPVSVSYVETSSSYKFDFLGNILYLAAVGDHLLIFDISDPSSPKLLEEFEEATAYDVAVTEGFICIADMEEGMYILPLNTEGRPEVIRSIDLDFSTLSMFGNGNSIYFPIHNKGLQILDVSDPVRPEDKGMLDIRTDRLYFHDTMMYIGYNKSIYLVDNSDPALPVEASRVDFSYYDVAAVLNYPYMYTYSMNIIQGDYKVSVVDIQDPANPVIISELSGASSYFSAAYCNDYLYLTGRDYYLSCVNLSDPENPVFTDVSIYTDSVTGFWVRDHYAYLTGTDNILYVYNMDNPLSPQLVNSLPTNFLASEPLFIGNMAYGSGFMGTTIYDFSDPAMPVNTGFISHPGYVGGKAISNGRLFIHKIIMEDRLQVYDLSQADNPGDLGLIKAYSQSQALAVKEDIIYVAAGRDGVRVFDFSEEDPLIARLRLPGKTVDLDISGEFLYLAQAEYGLHVINIADPRKPCLAGSYSPATNSAVSDIVVNGDFAYLIGGVYNDVVDISNPAQPIYAGELPATGTRSQGRIWNDYLYIADGYEGLHVLDISNPMEPQQVTTVTSEGYLSDVDFYEDYAYIPDVTNYLRIFDLTSPASPVITGSMEILYTPVEDISIDSQYAYLACDYSGLLVYDLEDPLNPVQVSKFYRYNSGFSDVIADKGIVYCSDRNYGVYKLGEKAPVIISVNNFAEPGYLAMSVYPNPSAADVILSYYLDTPAKVQLDIYDVNGRLVRNLLSKHQPSGDHLYSWDGCSNTGESLIAGLYFCRIIAGKRVGVVRIVRGGSRETVSGIR
jgi:hypothetical protein